MDSGTETSPNVAEVPGYAAWMFADVLDRPPDGVTVQSPASAPRGLWDLPIFARFWGADGADLGAHEHDESGGEGVEHRTDCSVPGHMARPRSCTTVNACVVSRA